LATVTLVLALCAAKLPQTDVDAAAQVFADAQNSTNYAYAKAKLHALKDSLTKAQQALEAAGSRWFQELRGNRIEGYSLVE